MKNPLLQRQLKKYLGSAEAIPDEMQKLFEAINQSYNHYQTDRTLIERSMDLSSQELLEANIKLSQDAERQRLLLHSLNESLRELRPAIEHSSSANQEEDILSVADLLRSEIMRRREAEAKLQESEGRFRLLAENSSDIIVRASNQGDFLYVSPACLALTGYAPESLIETSLYDLFHPDDISEIKKMVEDIDGGMDRVISTVRVRCHDGQYCWLESTVHAVRDPNTGVVMEYHSASRDVGERKRAEENIRRLNEELQQANALLTIERDREKEHVRELEALNQMKSEFVSSVSHELRTPLASIIGFAQTILLDSELSTDLQREFLQIILEEGKRLSKLINDLLDLARIESGRAIMEKGTYNLVPIIERAVQSIAMQADAKSIAINVGLYKPQMIANFDEDRMSQILINLLSNAVKFTPHGGVITVTADLTETEAIISVQDTGMGIPAEALPHLFEKFFRVHRPGLEIRGTGLGLAIVKQLIDMHGGTITVESHLEQGSTFTIHFPQ